MQKRFIKNVMQRFLPQTMTITGRTLAPIIEAMQQWGQTHLNIAGCEERGATGTRYK
jgi:DNA-binding HxlR family transcriptional regulator